jgi:hypothetical protein
VVQNTITHTICFVALSLSRPLVLSSSRPPFLPPSLHPSTSDANKMSSKFSPFRSNICLLILVFLLNYLAGASGENVCPRGEYDNFGTCLPCPRGTYGEVSGLKLPVCSEYCPKGRYNPAFGGKTLEDCMPCPPGRYGIIVGGKFEVSVLI